MKDEILPAPLCKAHKMCSRVPFGKTDGLRLKLENGIYHENTEILQDKVPATLGFFILNGL